MTTGGFEQGYCVSNAFVFLIVFLTCCNKILVVSYRLTYERTHDLNAERKTSGYSIDNTINQRQNFYGTRELESLDIRKLEYLIRYETWPTKSFARYVLKIPQEKENRETEQNELTFPREIISDSTIADKLLLKKLVQSSKLADQNSLKENRESVEFTFVKSIGNEPHTAYAVLQPRESSNERPLALSFAVGLVGVSGLVFVVLLCLHAPCCLRSRSRSSIELLRCPNRSLHDGVCGKCLFDEGAKTVTNKRAQKEHSLNGTIDRGGLEEKPHASISYDVNDDPFVSSQRPYTLQPLYSDTTERRRKKDSRSDHATTGCTGQLLRRTKERTRELRLSRQGYKSMKHYDRSPDMHDPEWTSAGEFLNRKSNYRAQNYGSTETDSFADRFRRRSRDSWGSEMSIEELNAELLPPPKPRKKTVELQEFPLGYSKYYSDSEPGRKVVFDPFLEGVDKISTYETESQTYQNIRFSAFDLDQKDSKKRSWKSKLKWGHKKSGCAKSCPAIVQSFPSTVRYNAQYIQSGNYLEKSGTRSKPSVQNQSIFEEDDTSIFQGASHPVKNKEFRPSEIFTRESVGREYATQLMQPLAEESPAHLSRHVSSSKYLSTSNLHESTEPSLLEGMWSSDSSIKKAIAFGIEPLAGLHSPNKKLSSSPSRKLQSKIQRDKLCRFQTSSVDIPVKETRVRSEISSRDCAGDSHKLDSCSSNDLKRFEDEMKNRDTFGKNRGQTQQFTGLSVSPERDRNTNNENRHLAFSDLGSDNQAYFSSSEFGSGQKEKCSITLPLSEEVRATHATDRLSYLAELQSPPVKDVNYN